MHQSAYARREAILSSRLCDIFVAAKSDLLDVSVMSVRAKKSGYRALKTIIPR